MATSNFALHESFDNGTGVFGNAWNVDTSVKGQVTLSGTSALMEWATGREAGHGYGTYTVVAKAEGNQPGPGIILWPGDNSWPGQEMDIMEITPDGSGRHYGTVHWNSGGSDSYNATIFDGVTGGSFHTYQMTWEPGRLTFKVDGSTKGVITDHVPTDYDHGGMNNTIGFLNINTNTSLTVSDVSFTPLGGSTAQVSSKATSAEIATAGAGMDWNAIAQQAMDHHAATGDWAFA